MKPAVSRNSRFPRWGYPVPIYGCFTSESSVQGRDCPTLLLLDRNKRSIPRKSSLGDFQIVEKLKTMAQMKTVKLVEVGRHTPGKYRHRLKQDRKYTYN